MIQTASHSEHRALYCSIFLTAIIFSIIPCARYLQSTINFKSLASYIPLLLLVLIPLIIGYYYHCKRALGIPLSTLHLLGVLVFCAFFYFHIGSNVVEFVHVPLYALLFCSISLTSIRRGFFVIPFLVCLAICCMDELFQLVTPNRVGDLRDITLNASASLFGALLLVPWNQERALKPPTYTLQETQS